MAISSINIKQSTSNSLVHNDRTLPPKYLLADDVSKGVECNRSSSEAQKYYMQLREEAFANYTTRTGQKVQTSEEKMRWSAVVNLNANHTLQDVQRLSEVLCGKYGWQEIQSAIHLDEGHINERGVPVLNRHAHIEFFMLNKEGIFTFKKRDFGIKKMEELQDLVSETLGMERGKSKLETKRERLEHKQYKQHVQAVEQVKEEVAYNFREMQKQITALEISSAEKKELHKENSELRKIIKDKNSTIEQQQQKLNTLQMTIDNLRALRKNDEEKNQKNEKKLLNVQEQAKELGEDIGLPKPSFFDFMALFEAIRAKFKDMQEKLNALEAKVKDMQEEINALKARKNAPEKEKMQKMLSDEVVEQVRAENSRTFNFKF